MRPFKSAGIPEYKVRQGYGKGKGKLPPPKQKKLIANTLQVRGRTKPTNVNFISIRGVHSGVSQLQTCNPTTSPQMGDEPYFGFACRLLPQALVRTEALDPDPLPTTDHDLPLGLLRVANWIVASRARHILVLNLDCKSYRNSYPSRGLE